MGVRPVQTEHRVWPERAARRRRDSHESLTDPHVRLVGQAEVADGGEQMGDAAVVAVREEDGGGPGVRRLHQLDEAAARLEGGGLDDLSHHVPTAAAVGGEELVRSR